MDSRLVKGCFPNERVVLSIRIIGLPPTLDIHGAALIVLATISLIATLVSIGGPAHRVTSCCPA
jgi:hypothetical protein